MEWVQVNTQAQISIPYKIVTSELELQDKLLNFDDYTAESSQVFRILKQPISSYEKDEVVQLDITFEMDKDLRFVSRDGYTILDLFSDIGGIQGMLISFFAIFMRFWNNKYVENFLAKELYTLG